MVGVGRADVAEAALPFGLVGQALEPLLGPETLAPSHDRDQAYERAANRLHAILHRFREVAVCPLLVALDDAHWADPDSLTLLRLMSRRLQDLPVALLATARPWPADTARAAEELSQQGLATRQRLLPLSDRASISLLTERLGQQARPSDLDTAVVSCAGNPLLLAHVAAELAAGQALPDRAGGTSGSWASRLLLSRFVGLGGSAEAYLRAASVLGGRFRPEVAADVADLAADGGRPGSGGPGRGRPDHRRRTGVGHLQSSAGPPGRVRPGRPATGSSARGGLSGAAGPPGPRRRGGRARRAGPPGGPRGDGRHDSRRAGSPGTRRAGHGPTSSQRGGRVSRG